MARYSIADDISSKKNHFSYLNWITITFKMLINFRLQLIWPLGFFSPSHYNCNYINFYQFVDLIKRFELCSFYNYWFYWAIQLSGSINSFGIRHCVAFDTVFRKSAATLTYQAQRNNDKRLAIESQMSTQIFFAFLYLRNFQLH